MSKYTTTVKNILESISGKTESVGLKGIEELINSTYDEIFDSDIPFYNEEVKTDLCKKILRHYLMYEIGFETPGLWRFYLNEKLRLIMPYYNELYKTIYIEYDPLINYKMVTEKRSEDASNTTTDANGNSNGSSNTTNKNSDYPQGNVLIDDSYLSTLGNVAGTNENHDDTHATTTANSNRTETETVTGNKSRSNTQLILEYRSAIINIEMKVIDELRNLFLTIF